MANSNVKWETDNACAFKMTDIYTEILNEYKINKSDNKNWSIYFPCTYDDTDNEIKKLKQLNLTNPNHKIFIIQNADKLASKSDLWLTILQKHGIKKAAIMCPMTYVLYKPEDIEKFKMEYDKDKIYILKKNIQRQEGLKLTKDKDEIINGYKNDYVIVQELLQDPYIINDRKINLRFYTLVICNNGKQDTYVFQDGFMYYTKHPFVKNSIDFWSNITTGYIDRWVYHINPLTHGDFRRYLNNKGISSKNVFNNIYILLRDLMISADIQLCQQNDFKFCTTFQLFGIDIALDENLQPKIIECNKGPNLNVNDKRDGQLKKSLVKDIFKVLGIVKDGNHNFVKII
jgi:hypothetical protein